MAYNAADDQVAFVDLILYRIDMVTAAGVTEAVNRQSIYEIAELALRDILRLIDRTRQWHQGVDGTAVAQSDKIDAGLSAQNYLIIPVPLDFLGLARIQTSEWKRSVDVFTDVTDRRYLIRFLASGAPDIARPMAVLVPRPIASKFMAIECYPLVNFSTASVSSFYYVQEVAPENISIEIKDALVAETAARVLFTTGDMERGEAQKGIAANLLQSMRAGLAGEEVSALETQGN